ncbi:hypothetical protein [Bradyrhizobium manausense]|nr:hypothetical protein [Bradyrhizobium manausense]
MELARRGWSSACIDLSHDMIARRPTARNRRDLSRLLGRQEERQGVS